MKKNHSRAYTVIELMVASGIIAMLIASALGSYIFIKRTVNHSMMQYNLTRDANIILMRIIRGQREGVNIYGLRSGSGFTVVSTSQLDYTGADGQARTYYVNGSRVLYVNLAQAPSEKTVYTAPADSTLTLRFWEPAGLPGNETVGIYIGITRQSDGMQMSGSASTYVNLRNVPK